MESTMLFEKTNPASKPDPGAAIRGIADRLLVTAGDTVDEIVSSEAFSTALAKGMGLAATTTASMRGVTHAVGEIASAWLNVPTRQQVIELSRRLTNLEMLLDDVDAKTSELIDRLGEPDAED